MNENNGRLVFLQFGANSRSTLGADYQWFPRLVLTPSKAQVLTLRSYLFIFPLFQFCSGYPASTWVIIPRKGTEWIFVVLLSIGGGTIGTCFLGLTVMMIEHWIRKQKWRKERKKSGDRLASTRMQTLHSFNSDVESSSHQGYHSY